MDEIEGENWYESEDTDSNDEQEYDSDFVVSDNDEYEYETYT